MILLDGKKIANEEIDKLKEFVSKLDFVPSLAIIQIGNIEESNKYIKNKIKKGTQIGVKVDCINFDNEINENDLINKIKKIQNSYDGLIVQLPLPTHLNSQKILDVIDLSKDVDGLSTMNMNNFYNNQGNFFCPATARAVLLMLQYYNIDLFDKNIVVIGESLLVGKPIKKLLSSFTSNISSRNKETGIKGSELADILIVAAGSPKLIKKENVKNNATVVDVGISVLDNKIISGDVDFDNVKDKVFAISPVPGGVGPLTVICLFKNLLDKFKKV